MSSESDFSGQKAAGLRLAVIVEGGLGMAAAVAAWLLSVPIRTQLPQTKVEVGVALLRGTLATVPLVVVFWLVVRSRYPEMRRLSRQVQWLVDELFGGANLLQLALVAGLAGFGEELLFRGVLLSLFERWTTPVVALVVTSLLFGLAHNLSLLYFVLATLIGVYFAWLTTHYGLAVAMISHGLYDLLALVYLKTRTPPRRSRSRNDRRGIER